MLLFVRRRMFLRFPDPDETAGGGDPKPEEKKEKKPEEQSQVDLAKAFKDLKENSVPKEDYEKLKKENQDLINQVINGEGDGNGHPTPEEKEADIPALREKLYGPKSSELSNLEFCKLTLELREAIMKKEKYDPFVPRGANIKPTDFDVQRAQTVAKVMQECIDEADGDSGVFTALLQAKTNNDSPALVAHLKKIGALK